MDFIKAASRFDEVESTAFPFGLRIPNTEDKLSDGDFS